jgi:hypothetical protein
LATLDLLDLLAILAIQLVERLIADVTQQIQQI